MATRSVSTGDDVEFALAFLAKEKHTTADKLFMDEIGKVFQAQLKEADEQRFAKVSEIMKGSDKGKAIASLRELLG